MTTLSSWCWGGAPYLDLAALPSLLSLMIFIFLVAELGVAALAIFFSVDFADYLVIVEVVPEVSLFINISFAPAVIS